MEPGHDRRQPAVVLVACDDPAALELLVRLVEREGWRPERAGDVSQAVAAAGSTLPRAVLVDLCHGGLGSALQLVDLVRSHDDRGRTSVLDEMGVGRRRRRRRDRPYCSKFFQYWLGVGPSWPWYFDLRAPVP